MAKEELMTITIDKYMDLQRINMRSKIKQKGVKTPL